jgi:hypothetical protein
MNNNKKKRDGVVKMLPQPIHPPLLGCRWLRWSERWGSQTGNTLDRHHKN